MEILVERGQRTGQSTPSVIYINGLQYFFGLEPLHPIPAGVYPVTVSYSPRLTERAPEALRAALLSSLGMGPLVCTPHLGSVPGRTEIEMHFGNTPRDTEGCTLVGLTRALDFVGQSDAAFLSLMTQLRKIAVVTLQVVEGLTLPVWTLTEAVRATYKDFAPPIAVTNTELGM